MSKWVSTGYINKAIIVNKLYVLTLILQTTNDKQQKVRWPDMMLG